MNPLARPHIPGLLDGAAVEGPTALDRFLSPHRTAWIVDEGSYLDAVAAVREVCGWWGTGADLLIPAAHSGGLAPLWMEFLCANAVNATATRGVIAEDSLSAVAGQVSKHGAGAELAVAALARHRDRERWAACFDPSVITRDHPWHLAYVGALGLLPVDPPKDDLRFHGLRDDLTVRDVLKVDTSPPDTVGGGDLLDRMRGQPSAPPVMLTMMNWAAYPPWTGSTFDSEPHMPIKYGRATRFNDNIVVIYTPGDAGDLCVLWNLRALYGRPPRAPLAVPVTEDVSSVIASWMSRFAFVGTGLRRSEGALVSQSVPLEQLEELAGRVGRGFTAAPLDVVLRPGLPLARHSSEVAVFVSGHARVPAWAPNDRSEVAPLAKPHSGRFTVRFCVPDHPIPPVRALSAVKPLSDRAAHGGTYARHTGANDVADLVIPHGWQVLSAACADANLTATASTEGHVAAELLHGVGGWDGLIPLLDQGILTLLQHLSLRRGMSWFKAQLNAIRKRVATADQPCMELAQQIGELSIAARGNEEPPVITMDRVQQTLDKSRKAAEAWLAWAEGHRLLHRGVPVKCPACRRNSWVPLAEMAPPVTCPRCGQRIEQPYGPQNVVFQYRASDLLLSVLELDSLPHLLAGRFLTAMFGPTFAAGYIYGVHPGVILTPNGERDGLDADVLALLHDGSLVPGECKRTAAGLKPGDLTKLDRLCEWLDAPWSFVATLDPADRCGDIWRTAERRSGNPRFVLTAEHLLAIHPIWLLNGDPLRFGGDESLHRDNRRLSELLATYGSELAERRPQFMYQPDH